MKLALKIGLPIILIAPLILGAWLYYSLTTPTQHSKSKEYLTINKGTSTQQLTTQLYEAGIIQNQWAFLLYIKLRGLNTQLKAGDYRFPSPITPLQVIAKLQEGQQKNLRLTVIEGWTRWDITNAITRLPEFNSNKPENILALMNNTAKIKDLDPQANNLEGYLYPDTYFFLPETKAEDLIEMMVNHTRREWTPQRLTRAHELNLTPRQITTIASLIETEAKLSEERPIVASVIYNRLRLNIPLGVDSAVIYASKLAGKWRNDGKVYKSDLERQSPYNTRLNTGLPPGPIASPSASSLEAALNPAQTNYLFYVRNPDRNDGAHNFYATDAEFQKGVQALRDWEQRQKTNAR